MLDQLDLLRTFGILAAVVLIAGNFFYHRGTRWRRSAFGFVSALALALAIVSIWPDSVNGLRDILNLGGFEYGRLLALAVLASFAGILLALYAKARADALHRLVDRVVCADAAERAIASQDFAARVKPITIIIPALNEARNLQMLLPRIPPQIGGLEVGVLVIDDGSTDGTGAVAMQHGALVARNFVRRGQGAACRVGYTLLHRCRVQFGVTMDGDNQHRPEDLPAMLSPLLDGSADFVLGSRVLGSAHASASAVRSAGVVLLSHFISLLSGQRITDCSSGFKALRMSAMARLDLREDQFQNSEVIVEATKKGLKIVEVPIHIALREHGVSHKGPNMTYGFFFLKTMVKTWWR